MAINDIPLTTISIIYIAIQTSIALFVSIIGAVHVKRCIKEAKLKRSLQTNERHAGSKYNIKKKEKGFFKLWIKTAWRMRGIYGGLGVHSFDVLTDVLVILEWSKEENIEGDHIDPQLMAGAAIFVMIFSKFISAIAIYIKERSITPSLLQFLDLLIFSEIYESHKKILTQVKTKTIRDKNTAIESTLSFKYIRNFEAVFESIPESVLQLVYVIRTGSIAPIFIVSICQSIISMTNSILNNDYTQMQDDKFAKYKQRLPPTFEMMKHALCRLCEISYRVGLLALFWSVCGGESFSILLGVEIVIIFIRLYVLNRELDEVQFDADTILLSFNSLIVIPTEYVYAFGKKSWEKVLCCYSYHEGDDMLYKGFVRFFNCVCCMCCCSFFVAASGRQITFIPLTRICISCVQYLYLIVWAFVGENGERMEFLFAFDHGLAIFIVTSICYLIYTQYMMLFPDFALPFGVSVRSKWGYALANELTELKKIKVPTKRLPYDEVKTVHYTISNEQTYWDEPYLYQNGKPITAAVIALELGHKFFVEYLEKRGAIAHKHIISKDIDIAPIRNQLQNERFGNVGKTVKFKIALAGVDGDALPPPKVTSEPAVLGVEIVYTKDHETQDINEEHIDEILPTYTDVAITGTDPNEVDIKNDERIERKNDGNESVSWYKNIEYKREYNGVHQYDDIEYEISNKQTFWDEPYHYQNHIPLTAAVFALHQNHHHIVKWLEKKGAKYHKNKEFNLRYFAELDLPEEELKNRRDKFGFAFSGDLEGLKTIKVGHDEEKIAKFWEEGPPEHDEYSAAVFALVKRNYNIVQWLEYQGAVKHKSVDLEKAKKQFFKE